MYVKDELEKKNRNDFVEGNALGKLDNLIDLNKAREVGIEESFVKADSLNPYIYTRDILFCFVILIECEDKAWMLHVDKLDENKITYIKNFYNKVLFDIKGVYVFPGMMSKINDLNALLKIFDKYSDVVHFPYYDTSYGKELVVGGLLYKYDKDRSLFFGLDRDCNVCQYDVNSICVSNVSSLFADEISIIKK